MNSSWFLLMNLSLSSRSNLLRRYQEIFFLFYCQYEIKAGSISLDGLPAFFKIITENSNLKTNRNDEKDFVLGCLPVSGARSDIWQ